MSDVFNPYSEWLGVPADVAEPNHYQLLGLPNFESDAVRIAIAADKAMSRVRSFRPGPNAKAWSKLLDELLLAKGRLLDVERKNEYDADLRETGTVAKTETTSSAPATTAVAEGGAWDPRFPPGMGPNVGKSAPKAPTLKETVPEEAPKAPEPARLPEPMAAPAPIAAPMAMPTPLTPVPTAWPTSMLHPVAHGPQPTPVAPLAQPIPAAQPAPLAQPMYAAPQMAAYPQAMPQQYGQQPQPYGQQPQYAQPAYGAPQYAAPAYPQQPIAYPQTQPVYPQPAYGQPQYPAYGMQPPAAPPQAEPPVSSYYSFGQYQPQQPQSPAGHSGYGPTAHSSYALGDASSGMALDPMAPVAMPTTLNQEEGKQSKVVGFAAHQAGASAIPRGRAVSSTASPVAEQPRANVESRATGSASADSQQRASSQPSPGGASGTPAPIAPALAPTLTANSVESTVAAARSEKSKSDQTLFYVSGGAILLLLGAIIFAVVNANSGTPEIAQNPGVNVPEEPTPKPTPKPVPVQPIEPNVVKKPPIDLAPMPPLRNPLDPKPEEPKPKPPVEPKPEEPKPVTPEKPPEKPPEPMTIPVPVPVPTPPKPADPPAEVKLTPAELMALSAAMNGAKEALRERNFDETDKQLATAKKLAKSAEQLAKFNRLDVLTQYVKQFDRSLKTLMADENFDAGSELTLGKSTKVVVVERSPTMIVIRINGMNRTYTLASMPDGLAMALIDLRLPTTDPVSKVIKGAYLAAAKISTEDNQAKAKELWAEALQEGISEVADLPLVLTDSYDFKE